MMNERLTLLEKHVASIFANSTQKKYWQHTKRVLAYARRIGLEEGANLEVLLPAVLLHDVGMTIDSGFPSHIGKSKLLGRPILIDLGYDEASVAKILQVLAAHHPRPGEMLDSVEEKVLFDADNMEIIGVFGVLRWIGTFPSTTEELMNSIDLFLGIVRKCIDARGSLFFTKTASRMGDKTVSATIEYYDKVKLYIAQFDDSLDNPIPISF